MTQIEKRPYELSLWEDVVSVDDGVITTSEKRLATIGSHTSTSPIAAFDILLNRKINGEKTLTFSISASYYDQEEHIWRTNPHLTRLTNERKVKLKWRDKWYDFIIKNVSEDSKKKVYTYTAKDQHIQELSRGGYNIQFDKELENNTKTPEEFIAEILKGTDWALGNFSEFFEYTTEAVYEYKVLEGLVLSPLFGGQSIILKGGETVFIPYSIVQNQSSRCQVLYGGEVNTDTPARNDEGVLIDEIFKNYYFDTTYNEDGQPMGLTLVKLRNDCRGKHYVRLAKTKYDANIDKYVKVYKNTKDNKEYYGYTETEYLDTEIAQNIITNSEDFVSTAGWKPAKIQEKDAQGKEISGNYGSATLETNPPFKDGFSEDYVNTEFLLSVPKQIFNTGFFDNKIGLGNLVEGQQYILDIEYSSKAGETGRVTNITVCDYEIRDASYARKTNGTVYINNNITATRTELTWEKTLSQEEIEDSKIGIFLTTNGGAKIKKIALYRKILDNNGELVLPNQIVFENKDIVSQKYCYYDPSQEDYSIDSLKLVYEGLGPSADYELQYEDTYQKRRSLTASKSNRFNLLQKVCETFEGWLDIQVEHESDGRIVPTIRNEKGEIESTGKKIGLKDFVGKENFAGFKYGTNLDSIKRTLDSNQITTKMIVESNANEFAKNGFCTITRSSLNPSGTNVVYNFDYYIKQGLLTQEATQEALNLYNKALKEISEEITKKQNEKINEGNLLTQAEAIATFEKEHVEAAQKGLLEAEEDLLEVSKHDYQWFVSSSKADKDSERHKEFSNFLENSQCLGYLREIIHYNQIIKQYSTGNACGSQVIVEGIKGAIEQLDIEIKQLIEQQKKIEIDFHNKFARFIQEGNWISEEYIDDDLYYIDSLSTLYTSSRPKVTYTINVFDLSGIEGYENYQFEIGDKTFVQDPEFFGWTENKGVRTPYKEEIVISESTIGIDNLTKDTIKVQNYKTQFEDLFQRIAAATETLQYNTGRYEKFSSVVETDGSISHQALQEAVNKNGLAIIGAGHQTVSCDERGIIAVDDTTPSNQVRIIGGGVFLTEDGGASWTTGITGEGINADTITSGIVNTGKVNIVSGGAKTHAWDSKGITSYKTEYDDSGDVIKVDTSTFVRQDEFGIYGIKNNAGFNARVMDATVGDKPKVGVEKIERDASYALTWDGFMLKSSDNGGRVEIDSEDDIEVYENDEENPVIRIGRLGKKNDITGKREVTGYGVQVKTKKAENEVLLGNVGLGNDEHGYEVFKAGKSNDENNQLAAFTVYEDGHVYIPSAQIGGYPPKSELQGLEIVALGGNIMIQGGSLSFKVQPKVRDGLSNITWTIKRANLSKQIVMQGETITIEDAELIGKGLITQEENTSSAVVNIEVSVIATIANFGSASASANFERKTAIGEDGNGITDVVNWYYLSSSNDANSLPLPVNKNNGWNDTIQSTSVDKPYLWGCEEIKYSILEDTFTTPRIISTYGNGVKKIYEYYQTYSNGSTAPTYNMDTDSQPAGWKTTPQTPTDDKPYLWNLEVVKYINDTFSTVAPRVIGTMGPPGVSGTSPYFINLSNDSAIIGTDKDGNYNDNALEAVSRTVVTVYQGDDPITDKCSYTWTVSPSGAGVLKKPNGKDNEVCFDSLSQDSAVATVTVTYGNKTLGTKNFSVSKNKQGNGGDNAVTYQLIASPNSWNGTGGVGATITFNVMKYDGASVDNITNSRNFQIKDRNIPVDINNCTIYDTTTFDLEVSINGVLTKVDSETVTRVADGNPGTDGRGISDVTEYYYAHYSSTAQGLPSVGNTTYWKTTVPTLNETQKYLWNYEEITYTTGSPKTTTPAVIGVFGKDGANGTNGRGISDITEEYAVSTSNTIVTSTWGSLSDAMLLFGYSGYKYLWNKEIIIYTDGSTKEFENVIAVWGDKGDEGLPGAQSESIRVFYRTNSTESIPLPEGAPNLTGTTTDGQDRLVNTWTVVELDGKEWSEGAGDELVEYKYHYVFSSTGVKTTTKKADGTIDTISYGSWTSPELYKAYHENVNQFNYAQFLKLTDFGRTDGLTYGTYKAKAPKVDANGEQEKDENGEPVLEEVDKEGLFVNASFINTGTLVVQTKPPEGTVPEDWEPETVLSIDADKGALVATNLTINASGLNLADNIFNFNVEKNGNPVTCLSFGLNGTEETSYIQALNRGATAEASQESIVVYCPGATQKSGTIRVNGGGSTKVASYSNGDSNIYLCLQKATKGETDEYTYISKESWGHNEVDKNEALYGRWLKCIVATETDNNGKITSWLNGFVYAGGSDTGKATFGTVLPGTSYSNANNAAKANAKLTNYLKEGAVTMATLVRPAAGGKGSKFDLYNDTIYLGPKIKLYTYEHTNAETGWTTPQLRISIQDPRDGKDKIWFFGVTSSGADDPSDIN